MTTRKVSGERVAPRRPSDRRRGRPSRFRFATAGWLVALALSGCATPGPLHVYSLANDGEERPIVDRGGDATAEAPSFLTAEDKLLGFAYDPFTDHFFLRLAPGNKIRVVDRPARRIKREFEIDRAELATGGDLAIRPRDGHVFFLGAGTIVETTRLGQVVRTLPLRDFGAAPMGIAYDAQTDRLLLLDAAGRRVFDCDFAGTRRREIQLESSGASSLGFDAERRELYAPLRDRPGEIGAFDETGKLVRTHPAAGAFVDVGPRSFVRVF